MSRELSKAYEPGAIEDRWAEYWVQKRLFSLPTPKSAEGVFTLLLPPPNVTGRLHMGHMLNQTEMDIIIRWKRMSGCKTLWVPGTDHAGIATQMMVERQLASEGKKRQELGREKFIEQVWDWKRHYGGAILEQMKRLGVSVDWSREYFTMDERLSRAVKEAFVRLYEKGLIYRGNYIVNWCPRCMTAISDLEVVHEETTGKLYEIRYPVIGSDEFITVATTRPETMLGDTAVAVNPKDARYKKYIGKTVRLPLLGREIPVVADDWANPEFGTGAVKVTPAHDPNDFEIGKRHQLPSINVMDESGRINQNGGGYAGLDRFEARTRVLADLEAEGLLAGVKDHALAIGRCTRCNTVVEPRLSEQWFVRVEGAMAERAKEAVRKEYIRITPENYSVIYLNWMENIHDWCISRQLWWGHRIPAWHCEECRQIVVAREAPEKCPCGSSKLHQDNDVLDTWFSSGLLPFTVFGWPDKTKELEVFYPTSLLITGFDILFFWVARMIMLSCWFMGDEDKLDLSTPEGQETLKNSVPFREVYIHALVRDAERQKMSKTKGNVVDPIEIIQRYGTDAVRFTLASMAAPGTDIAFSESRTDSYRAFANKIWNAARFMFMNVEKARQAGWWPADDEYAFHSEALEDVWIHERLNAAARQVNESLRDYRFHEAAHTVYHFFWGDFCDWYVEIVKLRLNSSDRAVVTSALSAALAVFESALRLLSPFMPFITEELWHAVYEDKPPFESVALAPYPTGIFDKEMVEGLRGESVRRVLEGLRSRFSEAESEMAVLQSLVTDVRNLRAELKVEPKQKVPAEIFANDALQKLIAANSQWIERLAGVEGIRFMDESPARSANTRVAPQYEVRIVHEQKIDAAAERDRLGKELKRLEQELANAQRQLSNESFLQKAPAPVVEGIRRREGEIKVLLEKARGALAELG